MKGFNGNIEELTVQNNNFPGALYGEALSIGIDESASWR